MGKNKLFWVSTLAVLLVASMASAQTVPDIFGPAAKAVDGFRMSQNVGYLGMVVFVIMGACALGFKSLKLGIGTLFVLFGLVFWYGGGDIARTIIPTSGGAIAP